MTNTQPNQNLPKGRIGTVLMWGRSRQSVSIEPALSKREFDIHMGPEYAKKVKEPVKALTAFRRTMNAAKTGVPTGFFWRKLDEDGSFLKFCYALETKDIKTDYFRADGTLILTFDKKTGIWSASDESHFQTTRIRGIYKSKYTFLTSKDYADIIKSLIGETKGFSINNACYFIPAGEDEWVPSLRMALEHTGIPVTWMPIASDTDQVEQYQQPAKQSLLDEIEILREEAEEFKTKDPLDVTREPTFERRIEKAIKLKDKARLFEDLLKTKLDDVVSASDELQAEFEKLKGNPALDKQELKLARAKRDAKNALKRVEALKKKRKVIIDTPEGRAFNILQDLSDMNDANRSFSRCQEILEDPNCVLDDLSELEEKKLSESVTRLMLASEALSKITDKSGKKEKRDATSAFKKAQVGVYRGSMKLMS
jgi:hypothetical protein